MPLLEPKIRIASKFQKLKWGVAGCGNFAENSFLPALQIFKKNRLMAVYSHTKERAMFISNKFGAPYSYDNFDEFLKCDFDILYISSANADHYWQVIKAAEAKKQILCEVPIAVNSQQVQEIINVCKENKIIIVPNYIHRFHPIVNKAKELVTNQIIGKIISISANYNIDLAPSENFRFNKKLSGGGALIDLGSQMIDVLRFFGGEISDVKGYKDNIIYKSEVEDFASAIVKFEKSGYGYFNVSYNAKNTLNKIEIIGYKGSISIENFIFGKNKPTKLIIDIFGEGKKVFMKRTNKLKYVIKETQKIMTKKTLPQLLSLENGLINLKIIEEVYKQCP
ncbi:Gfo/Idh/MocA family protein [Melioribacteraceae bacterium 4301-Me]|uniref:Gfo/Idh/MocA family protein n=1 Tax=Pyranulibacter aquaticus TaxID=3163344 RepID=UPI003597FA1A